MHMRFMVEVFGPTTLFLESDCALPTVHNLDVYFTKVFASSLIGCVPHIKLTLSFEDSLSLDIIIKCSIDRCLAAAYMCTPRYLPLARSEAIAGRQYRGLLTGQTPPKNKKKLDKINPPNSVIQLAL